MVEDGCSLSTLYPSRSLLVARSGDWSQRKSAIIDREQYNHALGMNSLIVDQNINWVMS